MSSLRPLICPAWDHFVFLTLLIISDFVLSLTHMLVFLSLHVILLNTSFHFGLCGSKFVMCLFGHCQMLQEVHIMEDTLMIPPAPTPNFQISRKP